MILGIDLSAKEYKNTGYFYISDKPEFGILHNNEDILNLMKKFKYIFIDAPLSYQYPYRIEEKLLYKDKFKPLPLSLNSMKELYERANYLRNETLKINKDSIIIETFPRAVEKILKLNYDYFKNIFKYKDEYDAYLAFLSGLFYVKGKYKSYGELILPKI